MSATVRLAIIRIRCQKFYLMGLLCLSTLTGCGITILPNGQPSAMGLSYNQLRESLKVVPGPSGLISTYRPLNRCLFKRSLWQLGLPAKTEDLSLSVKSVPGDPDKLLVVTTEGDGKVSTFLVERYSGKLLDFNSVNPSTDQRFTPEDYRQVANTDLSNIPKYKEPHVIQAFPLLMPQFLENMWNVGDVVSYVSQEDGEYWAQYVYRGVTDYDNQEGELFDLVRIMPDFSEYGPIVVGFMIFDRNTMVPILSILDAGTKIETHRLACDL